MNMDSITSVYSETRSEYTKQLCIYLVPAYFQFFVDLLGKAKQSSEPKKTLWQFQTYLNEVHDWNMEKVHNEITVIHTNTGCDYLEDLLTAVFIAHTKVLTAIRLSANNKKIEITIPKVEHFLFKVLCEISKLLWSSTYLFRQDISGIEQQQNYKAIEGIIHEGITQAIRSLVPVKSILKNLVNQEEKKDEKDEKDDKEEKDDSDDEDVHITKSNVKLEPKPAPITPPLTESVEECIAEPITAPIAESVLESISDSVPLVELEPEESHDIPSTSSDAPTIINLDEKPKVSFASFNSMFSTEDPEKSNMVSAEDTTPDLEILDQTGSALSSDDFDDLNESEHQSIDANDYEELP